MSLKRSADVERIVSLGIRPAFMGHGANEPSVASPLRQPNTIYSEDWHYANQADVLPASFSPPIRGSSFRGEKTYDEISGVTGASGIDLWEPRTGDIVLFGVDRKSMASRVIGRATNSEWTHTTIISSGSPAAVPVGLLAAASPESDAGTDGRHWRTISGDRLFIYETVSRLDAPMWDFLTGESRCGVRLVDAYRRMCDVCKKNGRKAVVRRVRPWNPALIDAIRSVQRDYKSGEYQKNPFKLLDAVLSRNGAGTVMPDYSSSPGAFDSEEGTQKMRAFCSQLVAEILKRAKMLPEDRPADGYLPADFAAGGSVETEMKKLGYSLTPPALVFFGPGSV